MNPILADASAAAILEGFRRAISENPMPSRTEKGEITLTDVVEGATEHAQGLAPRLPGTGERIDRTV